MYKNKITFLETKLILQYKKEIAISKNVQI